ncbi:MAG: hypothetical protein FWH59_00165 [Lentimicrobiaceae bacterium]|nr:hypothetical protein [Lentimicrobiaceae bacterium]
MNRNIILFFFIFIAITTKSYTQEFYRKDNNYVDSATFMIWGSPNFSTQLPFGQGYLSSTFNFNYNVGLDFTFKTKSNWTFDFAFNYMFGSKLRESPDKYLGDMWFQILRDNNKDTIPVVFNGAGNNGTKLAYEGRYWYFGVSAGKIIPLDRWKNSGLWLKFGVGYFGHKIHFTDPNNYYPQIDQKTYRLGYDQRSSAIALNQFFGYLFMHKKRVLSFYAGIEVWEIFSKPDRGYIFVGNLQGPTSNLKRKFSGLLGIKVGWILPFYETNRVTTYYTF